MDMERKRKKLEKLVKSVINSSKHKKEINYLMKKLNLTEEEVLKSFLDYNLDIDLHENLFYESLSMRLVLHIHNLMSKSWHLERQEIILKILNKLDLKHIADIGFGVPQKYVKEFILKNKKTKLTLVDLYKSAFIFSEAILTYWDDSWKDIISFKKYDMNSYDFVGDFDAYLFFDSIEHVNNPTKYLKKTVNSCPKDSKFILSLPIGPPTGAHHIAWYSNKEAKKWLNDCGLKIIEFEDVYPNPEVDLFAEQLGKDFHNFMVLCEKSD